MPTDIRRVIDRNLSGLTVTPRSRGQIALRIQGGKPMKKKMSLGLAIALTLVLLTAVALAAVLLGGKDMVEQVIAPMARETEGNRFTKEEVEQILAMAKEHGLALDETLFGRLNKEDGYYKEELARLFAKTELGLQPDTWSVQDQYWYAELYMMMEPDAERAAALPEEGELTQQEIEQAAARHITRQTGRAFPVLDSAQYEIGRTFTAIRQNPYFILREWWVTFRPLTPGLPNFSFTMTPQGQVTHYADNLQALEQGTPLEQAAILLHQTAQLHRDIQGSWDGFTPAVWQQLRDRLAATGVTAEEAQADRRDDMAQILRQSYTVPEDAIPREQAVEQAIQAVKEKYKEDEQKLRHGHDDYHAAADYVYAIYLETENQQRWKVSFGRDYLAEVDALTGQAELVDVYSPGNARNRRYVLDALIPQERRAFATPVPSRSDEEMQQRAHAEFFPTDLEAAPPYYWDALQGIGYNGDTATGIFTRLNAEYGLGDRYWPILYQAMVDARNGENTPGGIFRGIPAPEDTQEADAVKLARQSLKAAAHGQDAAYLNSLKPVVQFVYNSLAEGSRAWHITFAHFDENPMGIDFALVVIDAKTGKAAEVTLLDNRPSEVDGIPHVSRPVWSVMGDDGRPAVWGHPAAPESFWQHMAKRGDTQESVARDLKAWKKQYGENTAFWPLEQKAVLSLWGYHWEDALDNPDTLISGVPGPDHISPQQAETIAWDALKKAGEGQYTQEDYDSVRPAVYFAFSKGLLPADEMYQFEFMDRRTEYQTSIGMVWLDATDGTVVMVDTRPGQG